MKEINKDYSDLDSHISNLSTMPFDYFWHDHRFKTACSLLKKNRNIKSWLDFGCGSGWFLEFLNKNSNIPTIHGLDPSPAASGISIKRDFTELSQIYDVISLFDVLEHIENDVQQLIALREFLAEDGTLIITVPAFPSLWSIWDKKLGHFRRYTTQSAILALERAGFVTTKSSYMFSYLLPAAWIRAKRSATANTTSELEFPKVPKFTNTMLKIANFLERVLISITSIPFGTSLLVIARKHAIS